MTVNLKTPGDYSLKPSALRQNREDIKEILHELRLRDWDLLSPLVSLNFHHAQEFLFELENLEEWFFSTFANAAESWENNPSKFYNQTNVLVKALKPLLLKAKGHPPHFWKTITVRNYLEFWKTSYSLARQIQKANKNEANFEFMFPMLTSFEVFVRNFEHWKIIKTQEEYEMLKDSGFAPVFVDVHN